MPTVLGIVGTDASDSPADMTGRDLSHFVDDPDDGREFYGASARFLACISGQMKCRYCVSGGTDLLFDLSRDLG